MTKQHIYLPKYDWIIACYYNVKEKDIPDEIPSTGLFSRLNTGLTYTNPNKKRHGCLLGEQVQLLSFRILLTMKNCTLQHILQIIIILLHKKRNLSILLETLHRKYFQKLNSIFVDVKPYLYKSG